MANTGIGGTLTLTPTTVNGTAFTATWKSISAPEFTVDALDATPLNATGFYESVPDDLAKSSPITVPFYANLRQDIPQVGGVTTATITYPKQLGTEATEAKVVGTAIITRVQLPEMAAGTLLMGTIELTFDGKTGPTFTKAA